MVAEIPAAADRHPSELKSSGAGDVPVAPHHRPPLTPSEKNNAAFRAPRRKEITSRYLSSYASSSPSPSSSSTTTSGSSFSSSSSAMSPRRFPSPLTTSRASALPQAAAQKRSHSANRARPQPTPRPAPDTRQPSSAEPSAAARALCTTTRSLSVSFQGESFFYQTSRAKASPSSPARKPTPDRRRLSAVAAATPARAAEHSENSRPLENHHQNHLWPAAARAAVANSLIRILDCSSEKTEPVFATVKLLNQSIAFDDTTRRASFDGADLSVSSDSESVSSESNSGTPDFSAVSSAKASPRGICVPARFLQGTNSPLRRFPEQSSPLSPSGPRTPDQPKMGLLRKVSLSSSPRSASSPLRGPIRHPSPSKVSAHPSRGMASPLRARNGASGEATPAGQSANAPSIITFAAEVRRAKKGENRIEEAHMLRLFDNRHLQWRCINARINALLSQQKSTAEESLYNAWLTATDLRDSVTIKKIKLQILTQSLKIASILKGQMAYLEEWSLMDREHSSSLSAATEALKASTLRLPVGGGAKADIQKVKDAVSSAVDVMHAMASSICSLLTKVEGTNSLVDEIAKVSTQERALLDQSRDLLSTVAAMHVTLCSLQGHAIQLKRKSSRMQI